MTYFGLNDMWRYDICMCVYGVCNALNSSCTCFSGHYGLYCENNCTCLNGTCDDGINGTGLCLNCFTNSYGPNCNNSCDCVNGECNQLNGSCRCNNNYIGVNCDQKYFHIYCNLIV